MPVTGRGAGQKHRLARNQIAGLAGLFGKGGWAGHQTGAKLIENKGRVRGIRKKKQTPNLNSASVAVKCQPPESNLKPEATASPAKPCRLLGPSPAVQSYS